MSRRLHLVTALPLVALALWPAPAAATPPDTNGFGARSNALAGAVSADVEDASANYYNPAGIVRGEELRLSIGYFSTQNNLSINGTDSSVERISGMNVGIVAPAVFGDFKFGFGLGLHLPDQRLSRTRSSLVDRPRWELYDTRPHKVYLAANLAVQITRWLSFGAGITFQSPTELTLQIRGEANALQPERRTRLEHQFKGDLNSIRYPQAGVQLRPTDWLSIGINYRGEFEIENTLTALVNGDITGFGDPIPLDFALTSVSVTTFGPQQLNVGFAVHPMDALRIGFDLTWIDWSAHSSLIPSEDIQLAIEVPDGIPIDVPSRIMGRDPIDPEMRDRFVPRLGVEYVPLSSDAYTLALRTGYFYERTPFPAQRGVTNFVDGTRHSVSLGVGLTLTDLEPTLPGGLRFDVRASFHHLPDRLHRKTSNVDPVGDYIAGGTQWGIGANMEVMFE